jgi:hypothetical protein
MKPSYDIKEESPTNRGFNFTIGLKPFKIVTSCPALKAGATESFIKGL